MVRLGNWYSGGSYVKGVLQSRWGLSFVGDFKGNLQEPKLRWPCPLATKVKAVTARLVLHQLILQTDQRVCFYQVLGADAMTSSVLLNSSATTQNVYIYHIYTIQSLSHLPCIKSKLIFFVYFSQKCPFDTRCSQFWWLRHVCRENLSLWLRHFFRKMFSTEKQNP